MTVKVRRSRVCYLPVAGRQVLQGAGGALQGGGVGALGQQRQVRLDHRRVPQHLGPFGRLGEAGNGPDAVPLRTREQGLAFIL